MFLQGETAFFPCANNLHSLVRATNQKSCSLVLKSKESNPRPVPHSQQSALSMDFAYSEATVRARMGCGQQMECAIEGAASRRQHRAFTTKDCRFCSRRCNDRVDSKHFETLLCSYYTAKSTAWLPSPVINKTVLLAVASLV